MDLAGRNGPSGRDLCTPLLRPGARAYCHCLLLVLALIVESAPGPGCCPGIAVYGRRIVGSLRAQKLVASGTFVFPVSHQIQSLSVVPAVDNGKARKSKMASCGRSEEHTSEL